MNKALIFFASLGLIGLLGLFQFYGLERGVILPSFAALERAEAHKDIQRILDAFDREVSQLEQLSRDWSMSDNSYRFIQDLNPTLIAAHLNIEELATRSGIETIMVVDREQRLRWGRAYLPSSGQVIDGTPYQHNFNRKYQREIRAALGGEVSTGINHAPNLGPLLFSAQPILDGDGKGPVMGVLIMGRLIDQDFLDKLSARLQLNFRLYPLDIDNDLSLEYTQPLPGSSNTRYRVLNSQQLAVYGFLNDLSGEPEAVIEAVLNREIMAQGHDTARLVHLAVATAFSLLLALLGLLGWQLRQQRQRHQQVNAQQPVTAAGPARPVKP